jgi:tellurite resistance protein
MPSDAEIQEWGISLGHGPGPYPTKIRAQLAKSIQEGRKLETQARKDDAVSSSFSDRIGSIFDSLTTRLPADVAGAVTAAVAAQVYREVTTQENTAQ